MNDDSQNMLSAFMNVNLTSISNNYYKISKFVEPSICAATVKANAYGLGLEEVAITLQKSGCKYFFVSDLYEAIRLRNIFGTNDNAIYALNGLKPTRTKEYISHKITPVIGSFAELEEYRANTSESIDHRIALHFDTGFSRLGFDMNEIGKLSINGLNIDLIMSHLSTAEDPQSSLPENQLNLFLKANNRFVGIKKTIANSAAIFRGKSFLLDMVRPGISLYCGYDGKEALGRLESAIELYAPIIQIKDVEAGSSIGYGASYRAIKDMSIALVEYGYADGLPWSLRSTNHQSGGQFYFNNTPTPILGRVSMDIVAIDVTVLKNDVKRGDMVEIIGSNQNIDTLAKNAGTISYEILTRLNSRVKKYYKYV
ncbi:MAG: alanine racemase [Rhodobiaceae bacterium]|nr:alanine racemase [Rhodobiaceae bacterium]